jgi:hypothetical protein
MKKLAIVTVVAASFGSAPMLSSYAQGTSSGSAAVCAENFLSSDASHGRTDYGAAIDAAVKAQPLKEPSAISICSPGDHKVYTPIVFDRPVAFQMTGSRLIPQPSLASNPVTVSGAKLTAGSTTVSVPSTSGLRPGMAVGGTGVTSTAYISSVGPDTITLSLPASIIVNGVVTAGSRTIAGLNSMTGLAPGQTLTGYGVPSRTTITSLDAVNQTVTLSGPAVAGSPVPGSFTVGGSWTADLKAEGVTPVISWVYNPDALHNSEGQMIGGSMRGVWIASPSFRGLNGVQGVQIYGWDRMKVYDLQVENLAGSALILGGDVPPSVHVHGTVRESYFYDSELRDCGEWSTGQPVLELMTGTAPGDASDEINQIGFIGGQVAFYYGEAVTIGTFNPKAGPIDGPRLLWFNDNFQMEGGTHLTGPPLPAPVDTVHLIRVNDVYFDGDEIAAPGFGKSLVRIDNANVVSILNSLLYARGKHRTYTVSTTSGAPGVAFVGGPVGVSSFDASGWWDGYAAEINDGASCAPCSVHLRSQHAVDPSGNTLTLSSPFRGAATRNAAITLGFGGYFINDTGATLSKFTALGNRYEVLGAPEARILGLASPAQSWNVGTGFLEGKVANNANDFGGFNASKH